MTSTKRHILLGAATAALVTVSSAQAGSHLWVINEVFSNADGSIQFIEMANPTSAANEIVLKGKWVRSGTTLNQYDFPANLPAGSTANKHLLLATASFAALPGAPTPDYIIPENFFDLESEHITYWLYAGAHMDFNIGDLTVDGIQSLNRNGNPDMTNPPVLGVNSPTNFNDETGSVDASGPDCPADLNTDGTVGIVDLLALLAAWGGVGPAVLDGSGAVGIVDLLILLTAWGPCK